MGGEEKLLKALNKKKKAGSPYSSPRWYQDLGFEIVEDHSDKLSEEEQRKDQEITDEVLNLFKENDQTTHRGGLFQ